MKSSPLLEEFYRWWLGDKPSSKQPANNLGLCQNLADFVWDTLWSSTFSEEEEDAFFKQRQTVLLEMQEQFMEEGLSYIHPFNLSYADYVQESATSCCHKNPCRVQWVFNRLMEADHESKN